MIPFRLPHHGISFQFTQYCGVWYAQNTINNVHKSVSLSHICLQHGGIDAASFDSDHSVGSFTFDVEVQESAIIYRGYLSNLFDLKRKKG